MTRIRTLLEGLAGEHSLVEAEERADLLSAINTCPADQRELAMLLVLGYSGVDIARKLHISPATVTRETQALYRALAERMNA